MLEVGYHQMLSLYVRLYQKKINKELLVKAREREGEGTNNNKQIREKK